ncbi:hypothetical protein DWV52_13665 [Ruminococcaceae bacterium AF10-16]|nr:hypothetical protein DWV52_13665 [Ruminococcaceae bacterium AF10-16]
MGGKTEYPALRSGRHGAGDEHGAKSVAADGQSGGSAPPPPPAGGAAGPAPSAPPPPPPQGDPMGDLSSLLGGIDPGMIAKLLPVLSQLNRPESGETAAFLRALRPFLKPERQDKVERAAQLARFIHLGKTLLLSEGGPRNV